MTTTGEYDTILMSALVYRLLNLCGWVFADYVLILDSSLNSTGRKQPAVSMKIRNTGNTAHPFNLVQRLKLQSCISLPLFFTPKIEFFLVLW